jgi:hypothetical protein
MKKVLLLVLILFSFNIVYAGDFYGCNCGSCFFPVIAHDSDYDYCIVDSDCTQSVSFSSSLGPFSFGTSHGSFSGGVGPNYNFYAPNICTTPGGCTSPVNLQSANYFSTFTIPADTYPAGTVYAGNEVACGGGAGETSYFYWEYLNSFGSIDLVSGSVCDIGSDCHIVTDRFNREIHGGVRVVASQGGTSWGENNYDGPSSIQAFSEDIEFIIPADTFNAGEVMLKIYDLDDSPSIGVQSGGSVVIEFIGSMSATIYTSGPCFENADCDIVINVQNVPINILTQEFGFYGPAGHFGPIDLGESGVVISSDEIYYTIPANTFVPGDLVFTYGDRSTMEEVTSPFVIFSSGTIAEICDDGIDNDGDSDIDCTDSECISFSGCLEFPGNCGDGIDNNLDGYVDCADSSCELVGFIDASSTFSDYACDYISQNEGACTDCAGSSGGIFCSNDGAYDYCCADGTILNYDSVADKVQCVAVSIPSGYCGDDNIDMPNLLGLNEICDGSALSGLDCTDFSFINPLGLSCLSNCTAFDTVACTNSIPITPPPVTGPNEYIVYNGCADDGDGNQYGITNWTLYSGDGTELNTSTSLCVLYSSNAPFLGFYGILLFFIVLFGFYYREKRIDF